MSFLRRLRRGAGTRDAAHRLYGAIVSQARRPEFYRDLGVPDTLDGRFDMIALHAHLVLRRLRPGQEGKAAEGRLPAHPLGQSLFDLMFADMDRNLREIGVSDLSVGKHVKAMARGFYGRIAAYDAGLDGGDGVLESALRRNLFGTVAEPDPADVEAVAGYMRREWSALEAQDVALIEAGEVRFGPPPERSGT